MWRNQKMFKKLSAVLVIWVILLSSPIAYSADVCFDEKVAAQIVVDLEKYKILQQQLNILEKQNEQLEKQIELHKQINALQRDQIEITKKTLEDYKKLMEDKDKLCEQKVKDAKPTLSSTIVQNGIFTLIGVAIGALLF